MRSAWLGDEPRPQACTDIRNIEGKKGDAQISKNELVARMTREQVAGH
jgi:hypothetical protein